MADYSKDLYDYKYECIKNCSAYDDGYQQGRADAEKDFQNSDYWNDYLEEVKKQIREEVIDEILNLPKHWYKCYDGHDEIFERQVIYVYDIEMLLKKQNHFRDGKKKDKKNE